MGSLDLSQFKDFFVNDVEDNLQKLNDHLLNIEKTTPTSDDLDQLMWLSHSIKGASATMGYNHMAFLTHVMEDVFDYARHDQLKLNTDIINDLFTALDKLEQSLDQIKATDKEIDFSEFSAQLKKKTGVATVSVGKSVRNWDDNKKEANKQITKPISSIEQSAPDKDEKPMQPPQPKPPEKKNKSTEPSQKVGDKLDFIKVRVSKLDKLMDLSEELLIEKLNLEELEKYCRQDETLQKNFKNIVSKLDSLIKETQYHVMASRLVPISYVFMQYPRLVRDISHSQNKTIELEMDGGDLELDRSIIEKLGEPLNHLIRNAVDHGIQDKGKIKLQARREKEFAIIQVIDDGAGLDLNKLVKKAVENRVIKEKDAEKYISMIPSNYPAQMPSIFEDLLFNPKISTSEKVTEISGRGVGLTAVKNFADSIGGIITVQMLEHGTAFHIKIPLSLAMIGVLLVRAAANYYAIPLTSIISSVVLDQSKLRKVLNYDVGLYNGTEYPILKLHQVFGLESDNKNSDIKHVVLIKNEDNAVGLAVDELVREQDVVVKPMSAMLSENAFFSGVSLIGNGKTVPIIDVHGLTQYLINTNTLK